MLTLFKLYDWAQKIAYPFLNVNELIQESQAKNNDAVSVESSKYRTD